MDKLRRSPASVCGIALLAAASALAATPTPEQQLAEAKRALDRKEFRHAGRLAQRIVDRYPTSPVAVEAWLVVVDALIERERWPQAFEQCERLLAAHPDTRHRTAVLQREFQIGERLAASKLRLLFIFPISRLEEGVKVLERVIEHAPFGPLAERAAYAIGEAYFRADDYAAARDAYDRLLKQYPNSDLVVRARVRRATCNQRLTEGPAYDLGPTEAARAEMQDLARESGSPRAARYAQELSDVMARGDYEAALFYFGRYSIDGGVRSMQAVVARYPGSEYAARAERILALVKDLLREAESEGGP
mgnify:CR=1 FL=1